MMRKIGYKDRGFYYRDIKDLQFDIEFKEDIVIENLKEAFHRALKEFPEFAVQAVKSGTDLCYMENHEMVAFYNEDVIKPRYMGTEETNHYLFYVSYYKNRMKLSIFHGLTDGGGAWMFIQNIVYHYFNCQGIELPDIRVRLNLDEMDEKDMFDPYSKYADKNAKPEWEYRNTEEIFCVPEENIQKKADNRYAYHFQVSTEAFLNFARSRSTSFLPAFVFLFSNALAEEYQVKKETIVAYSTANMRRFFPTGCRTNFSEVFSLPLTSEDRKQDSVSQCKHLKATMQMQLEPTFFQQSMAAHISNLNRLENVEEENPVKKYMPMITYLVTYPGKMEFPVEYQPYIKDVQIDGYSPSGGIAIYIKTTGDRMDITLSCTHLSDRISNAFMRKVEEQGMKIELIQKYTVTGNKYSVEKLKKFEKGEQETER